MGYIPVVYRIAGVMENCWHGSKQGKEEEDEAAAATTPMPQREREGEDERRAVRKPSSLHSLPLQCRGPDLSGPEIEVLNSSGSRLFMRSWLLGRVNQHPPRHQLAVLSIGWAAFSSGSLRCVNQHCTIVNLFMAVFSQPSPPYYPPTYLPYWPSYPANLHLGLMYQLSINPTEYLPCIFF
jgi:hypothetical protein